MDFNYGRLVQGVGIGMFSGAVVSGTSVQFSGVHFLLIVIGLGLMAGGIFFEEKKFRER